MSATTYSMTAFVRQELQQPWGALSWEIRSLNHRYLEIYARLPEELKMLEAPLRERIGKLLKRGKIECFLRFQPGAELPVDIKINQPLAQQLIVTNGELSQLTEHAAPLNMMEIMQWPGVLQVSQDNLEVVKTAGLDLLDQALRELLEMRAKEGEQLQSIIEARLQSMSEWTAIAKQRVPFVVKQFRQRLEERLEQLLKDLDAHRVEQELVMLTQKMDVDEELERLRVHIQEVQLILHRAEPIGRRLDFLLQELNREANTLASKSVDVEMTQAAVELKVLIEQVREQVQNIE